MPIVAVAHPDHPLHHLGRPVTARDLRHHRHLVVRDSGSLLPPFTPAAIEQALQQLAIGRLLRGYRGRSQADVAALVDTAMACTRFAEAQVDRLVELDMNPVIVRARGQGAVAVDALIRLLPQEHSNV